MRLRISQDARPQAMTLLIATAISLVLWWIPFTAILYYPFQLFVTFIHEGGHAIAALLTGNSVGSLSVAPNTTGLTYTTKGGMISQILISSAGYVGAMAFGALLLVLIRKRILARVVLLGSAVLILGLTLVFGFFIPLFYFDSWSGIPFTLLAGVLLSVGLIAIAKFSAPKVATFFVSFLAVQCVLNALFNLKDVLALSSPFSANSVHTDAVNMANATGIPAILWAVLWIVLGLGILWFAMRLYVAGRDRSFQPDLPFEDAPPV